ncbi:MAG: ABC transporter permease [Bernardetiaceae bacterium]|nr:ABC transporter permease [Bernardetiaceae bacterium]
MKQKSVHQSPTYYVRKKLLRSKSAIFGLIVISAATMIALLGYTIMPDSTPYVSDSSLLITKQMPGFSVSILKMRKQQEVAKQHFFTRLYNGQESEYTSVPIQEYRIVEDTVFYKEYGRRGAEVAKLLVSIMKPIYSGESPKFIPDNPLVNYTKKGDIIRYLDIYEEVQEIKLSKLVEEFEQNNITKRTYWLGTDRNGRDMLSCLLYGTRISLMVGFIAVLISLFLGVSLGAIAGYYGGRIDSAINWLMTILWSIPSIMLVVAITMIVDSKNLSVTFLAVGCIMWVEIARVVRGQIISIKQKPYIEAVRAFGMTNQKIIFNHILPNVLGIVIITAASNFATAILLEAGLSFLGLGGEAGSPSWGYMVYEGHKSMNTSNSLHLLIFPSICIATLILAFNLFGNALRDAYDPSRKVN